MVDLEGGEHGSYLVEGYNDIQQDLVPGKKTLLSNLRSQLNRWHVSLLLVRIIKS